MSLLLIVACSIGLLQGGLATAAEPVVSAEAAILVDAQSGQVLWERNSHARMYPASLTKIMTGLLAVETRRLEEYHTASELAASTGESSISLQRGEQLKLQQVLRASLIKSANDATVMVAESVGGSLPQFVDMMNRRAEMMGLHDTHFVNPHGLHDPQHHSSAADLAELSRQAMLNATFARIVGTREAIIPWTGKPWARKLVNRNRLLLQWDECDGIKTGYTRHAGRCLSASATADDGWRLIAVVLNCKDSWADARSLLEWGRANYHRQCVVQAGQTYRVRVVRGARRYVRAQAAEALYAIAPVGVAASTAVDEQSGCEAPVQAGQTVGALVAANGATVPLICTEDVGLSIWARLSDLSIPQGFAFVIVLLSVGVLLHGAGAKATRARRRRLKARERETDTAGTSDDRRATGTTGR